jgi:hypothetical protein
MDRPQTLTGRGAAQDCGDATTRAAWRRSGQGVCVRDPLSTAKRLQISTPLARAARLVLQLVHLVSSAVHSAHPAQAENKHTARSIISAADARPESPRSPRRWGRRRSHRRSAAFWNGDDEKLVVAGRVMASGRRHATCPCRRRRRRHCAAVSPVAASCPLLVWAARPPDRQQGSCSAPRPGSCSRRRRCRYCRRVSEGRRRTAARRL